MIAQDFSFKKVEQVARLIVPYTLLVLLVLLHFVSMPFLPEGFEKPYFVLMPVFYWSIYRPTLIPPFLCFVMGMTIDILGGMPPGLNAFMIVLLQWLIKDQRRFLMAQSYGTIWGIFAFVCLGVLTLQWVLYGISNWGWPSYEPVLKSTALTALLFPFVTWVHIAVHRILPVASKAYH